MGRRPNLFIIGAPKTGTTSLYSYLEGHPDVFMSPVKEPMYFSPDVQGVARKRMSHPDGEAEYLALFDGAHDEKVVGEASTRYMLSTAAPKLVREFDPKAHIVAVLRNPVDMVHALHSERVSYGMETITDFELAISADEDRLAGRLLRGDTTPEYGAYRPNARYGEQLARWFDTFGREKVHVIVFDDLSADTPGEFRRLLEFLGIDPHYQPATFEVRRSSHRRRGGPLRVAVENPVARWFSHRALPAMLGRANSSRLVWRFRQSKLNLRSAPRTKMRDETRQQLQAEFAPDVARLSELLGRDLSQQWFGGSPNA